MEWKLYEEYKKQDEKALALTERYAQKVKDAKEGVAAAVLAYEDVLKKEFAGESVATQKKKAVSDIEKARAALQVAEEEAKQANDYAEQELQGSIDSIALWHDWNENIEPAIRKERLEPIVGRAKTALKEYYSALADFYKLGDEFSGLLTELQEIERSAWRTGRKGMRIYTDIAQLRDMPKPSDEDLAQVYQTRDLPDAFKEEN
ncbi:hypothetical protein [Bacillus pseudomycoides]|uniref:hypothetical protein n=1 Tax=Bacillus pseudomycoides TaxID=64104 RepID=UPI000BED7E27|nr:hypothetical protein [Bacillus pseudomycoides]PEF24962.1 hypothetical protein CON69_10420 [Bacillus pseudomycoides]PGD77075.1 hypothetical protein COM46_08545 [Bacillus pseudomycoides]